MREQCPHCGSAVLFTADKCPSCGKASTPDQRVGSVEAVAKPTASAPPSQPPSILPVYGYAIWALIAICLLIGFPRMDRFYFYLWIWPVYILFVTSWIVIAKLAGTIQLASLLVCAWLILGVLPTTLYFTRCYDLPKLPASDTIPKGAIVSRTDNHDGTETVRYSVGRKAMDDAFGGLVLLALAFPSWGAIGLTIILPLFGIETLMKKKRSYGGNSSRD